MERGRTFYISLVCGLAALVLLLVSINLPAQLVFETKPYALVVLKSGNLDGWRHEELGITSAQLTMVKNNYAKFLSRHRSTDDSGESFSSSDEDDENGGHNEIVHASHLKDTDHVPYNTNPNKQTRGTDKNSAGHKHGGLSNDGDDVKGDDDNDDNDGESDDRDDDDDSRKRRGDVDSNDEAEHEDDIDDDRHKATKNTVANDDSDDSSSSSSSDSDEGGESSDSNSLPLEQRLKNKALTQTVGLGLFHGKLCSVMKDSIEECHSLSVNEAIFVMNQEVRFMLNDINMPMWNNLRVESLFSVISCVIGLVCLFASLKPCCDNKRLPVYLGSVSFFASGVLVFVPIVRLLLVSADFEQNLVSDINVTTKQLTSWSLLFSGLGAPFALMASFTLIATKWYKVTKKWYHVLRAKDGLPVYAVPNGKAVEIKMTDMGRKEVEGNGETRGNVYQNVEEKLELLEEIDREQKLRNT